MFVYGEAKEKLKDSAQRMLVDVHTYDSLDEATYAAFKFSQSGDTILLSPACASWDQFSNFEERGNRFVAIVESMK